MNCYNEKCQKELIEPRELTAFCSKECQDAFYGGSTPTDITPGHKHSIADVQRMLLEKAKTAPKADPDPIVQEIIESHPVPTPPEQSLLLPYADD